MSITVGIINGKQPSAGVGGVSDADLSNLLINAFSAGVVGSSLDTNVKVTQTPTASNQVRVNTGKLYVPNPAGSMLYHVTIDANVDTTVPANTSGNPRIDAVVVKVDTAATPNNLASNVGTVVLVQGTPAGSPTAPSDSAIQTAVGASNAWLKLAEYNAPAGFATIPDANITDKRTFFALKTTWVPSGSLTLDKIASEAWTTYTPTWGATGSAPSIGNGTLTGRYKKIGRTVVGEIQLTIGSTTNKGSGNYTFTPPVTPVTTNMSRNLGVCTWVDSGNGNEFSGFLRMISSSAGGGLANALSPQYTSTASAAQNILLASSFMTWAAGSTFSATFEYEAAS